VLFLYFRVKEIKFSLRYFVEKNVEDSSLEINIKKMTLITGMAYEDTTLNKLDQDLVG
jgi:hypothetical protein